MVDVVGQKRQWVRSVAGFEGTGFSVAVSDGKGEIGWTRFSPSLDE